MIKAYKKTFNLVLKKASLVQVPSMRELRRKADIEQDPQAMLDLADCLMCGFHGLRRDPMLACEYYWNAASAQLPEACIACAKIHQFKILGDVFPELKARFSLSATLIRFKR